MTSFVFGHVSHSSESLGRADCPSDSDEWETEFVNMQDFIYTAEHTKRSKII